MISRLSGVLLQKQAPYVLIDVQGVGYEVQAPMSTFYKLSDIEQPIILYTHLSIRDDAHVLFGFATETERHFFRALIKVNGVGPKLALSILSGIEPVDFVQCIQAGNLAQLIRIPGVGKKTAERLVVEMRDKLKDWQQQGVDLDADKTDNAAALVQISAVDDAISALIALGYPPQKASQWVHGLNAEGLRSEDLIRQALKNAVVV